MIVQKSQAGLFSPPWKFGQQIWMFWANFGKCPPLMMTKVLAKVLQRWNTTTHLQPNLAAWWRAGTNILGWGWISTISSVLIDCWKKSVPAASTSNDLEKYFWQSRFRNEANPSKVMPRCKKFWAVTKKECKFVPKVPLIQGPFASLNQNLFVARQTPE